MHCPLIHHPHLPVWLQNLESTPRICLLGQPHQPLQNTCLLRPTTPPPQHHWPTLQQFHCRYIPPVWHPHPTLHRPAPHSPIPSDPPPPLAVATGHKCTASSAHVPTHTPAALQLITSTHFGPTTHPAATTDSYSTSSALPHTTGASSLATSQAPLYKA